MKGTMVDDCIVLLAYVSKHRNEPQSIRILADACGIHERTLFHILTDCRSTLLRVAHAYGYAVFIYPERRAKNQFDRGQIIDVEKLIDRV